MKFNVPLSRLSHTENEFRFDKLALVSGLLSLAEKNPEIGLEFQAVLIASSKVIASEMRSSDIIIIPLFDSKENKKCANK